MQGLKCEVLCACRSCACDASLGLEIGEFRDVGLGCQIVVWILEVNEFVSQRRLRDFFGTGYNLNTEGMPLIN